MHITMLNRKFNKFISLYKNIKLYFQIEHNLVLPAGRSITKTNNVEGNVDSVYQDGTKYLVRVVNLPNYINYDFIIEYSLPNVANIKLSNKFSDDFINKIIYLPPLIFDFNYSNTHRTSNILTTFRNTNQKRRHLLLQKFKTHNLNTINVNNVFTINGLKGLYDRTKIVVNIHQTDHHHTLEEFRILPALQRGVVIISEIVPLMEEVPYKDYIVWTKYEDVIDTIKEVEENYVSYYEKFYGENSELESILIQMEDKSYEEMKTKFIAYHK